MVILALVVMAEVDLVVEAVSEVDSAVVAEVLAAEAHQVLGKDYGKVQFK